VADWQNGAAWPGAAAQGASTPTDTPGALSPRESRQFQVIRRRVLTAGGNTIALPVLAALTSLVVVFPQVESDVNYGVSVTPNWGTTVWVTTKTVTGYTVHFGTAAPASALLDITTFRTES
jgi:hypothetical protein